LAFAEYSKRRDGESCDHIVGVEQSSYPEDGEMDRLVRTSWGVTPDETFRYCPECGVALQGVGECIKLETAKG
jgi:hypothetical protein